MVTRNRSTSSSFLPFSSDRTPLGLPRTIAAIFGLLLFLSTAQARDFFVNDASEEHSVYTIAPGNDDFDGRTPATPKASVASILLQYEIGPGDRIFVDTGTYDIGTPSTRIRLGPDESGTRGHPVSIIGSPIPGGTVFQSHDSAPLDVFMLLGRSAKQRVQWIHIQGITFRTQTWGIVFSCARHLTIRACRFEGQRQRTVRGRVFDGAGVIGDLWDTHSSDIRIEHCVFWRIANHGVQLRDVPDAHLEQNTFHKIGNSESCAAVRLAGRSPRATLLRNIISVDDGSLCLSVDWLARKGFTSDHSVYWTGNRGRLVRWGDRVVASLEEWHALRSQNRGGDFHSQMANPHFVDPEAGDLHLASTWGHYTNALTWDVARESSPVLGEPQPGAYGQTWQMSRRRPSSSQPRWIAAANPVPGTPGPNGRWPTTLDRRSEWDNPGNWNTGRPPESSEGLVITETTKEGPAPTLDGDRTLTRLVVEAGCRLHLTKNSTIRVKGDVMIRGELTGDAVNLLVEGTLLLASSGQLHLQDGHLRASAVQLEGDADIEGGQVGSDGTRIKGKMVLRDAAIRARGPVRIAEAGHLQLLGKSRVHFIRTAPFELSEKATLTSRSSGSATPVLSAAPDARIQVSSEVGPTLRGHLDIDGLVVRGLGPEGLYLSGRCSPIRLTGLSFPDATEGRVCATVLASTSLDWTFDGWASGGPATVVLHVTEAKQAVLRLQNWPDSIRSSVTGPHPERGSILSYVPIDPQGETRNWTIDLREGAEGTARLLLRDPARCKAILKACRSANEGAPREALRVVCYDRLTEGVVEIGRRVRAFSEDRIEILFSVDGSRFPKHGYAVQASDQPARNAVPAPELESAEGNGLILLDDLGPASIEEGNGSG